MKPIVIETLDFQEKKARSEQRGPRRARLLFGFAYATFHAIVSARTHDAGIRLLKVNPAYTSVIGRHTFAERYGLSRHQAAAVAIGRRGMQLAERPSRRLGDRVTFPLPVRNRGKHVWSFWRQVARQEAALRAQGRPGSSGVRSSPAPAPAHRRSVAQPVIRCTPGRLHHLPAELRHANRQQCCSADVGTYLKCSQN
jgi:IS605 OrfB family transposase